MLHEDGAQDLLVPWMKDRGKFMRDRTYSDVMGKLGATMLTEANVLRHYILPLPDLSMDQSTWLAYESMVQTIFQLWSKQVHVITNALRDQDIAVDQTRTVGECAQLFDHTDNLFIAAFRFESATKFLHLSLRPYRHMWIKLGSKHNPNNMLHAASYIEALSTIHNRLAANTGNNVTQLHNDLLVVLAPLISDVFRVQEFSSSDWDFISAYEVFRARSNVNTHPAYRRVGMEMIAAGKPLLSLEHVIFEEYASCCWSQTAFPIDAPSRDILRRFGDGRPSVLTVWRHLLHLKEMTKYLQARDLKEYLHDLADTYNFLQQETCDEISEAAREEGVWLNLPSFDGNCALLGDVQSCWVSAKNLVLSSTCDSGDKKAVKDGLMRLLPCLRRWVQRLLCILLFSRQTSTADTPLARH